jgi:membrane dipeptidase
LPSRAFFVCLAGVVLCSVCLLSAIQADDVSARALSLHRRAIVVDTHVDVPSQHFDKADPELGRRHDPEWGHIDIPRMREGGLDAPFFSIYIPATTTGPEAVKQALQLIDWTRQQIAAHPNDLALATTAADVRRFHRQGKIAVLMGMEGGHMIADDTRILRMYAELGVRYLTLTHTRNTNWADSSTDAPKHNGLTDFGKEVVRELNRAGVMVDVSHVSDKTFWDALEASRAPMIASHSSCRALCNTPRNMSDEMIKALAQKGGVIQITFVDAFLSQGLRDYQERTREEREAKLAEVDKQYASDAEKRRAERRRINREYRDRGPRVSWEAVVNHIDHAVKIAGVDHVGLGSDFDGATMPEGMEDASKLPHITEALLKRGYRTADIAKILGGNLLRVFGEVERVSRQMKAEIGKQQGTVE